MAKTTILIVEDDQDILDLISHHLVKEGYTVRTETNGSSALLQIGSLNPDLILLDIMLPGIDGLEICRQVKSNTDTADIPIIMVSAKDAEADITKGLDLGADDYVTKPFSPSVLASRVKAVLRRKKDQVRAKKMKDAPVVLSDLYIDPGKHSVRVKNRNVSLTMTEFQILYLLASNPGWVYTRYQIVEAVRGDSYHVTDRSVDVLVFGLRKKLEECGEYIETVRGIGYRFKE
ncbi:MAG: response regulator transcription factor [Spirochaetales bacterium]|nr:response regulator transcription factor [Spirochaetales bacterium]